MTLRQVSHHYHDHGIGDGDSAGECAGSAAHRWGLVQEAERLHENEQHQQPLPDVIAEQRRFIDGETGYTDVPKQVYDAPSRSNARLGRRYADARGRDGRSGTGGVHHEEGGVTKARHDQADLMIELYGTSGLQAVAKEGEAMLTDIMAEAAR